MYNKEKDQVYLHWLNSPNLDKELRKELEMMNDQEIYDSFYTQIEFGTAGMRGLLGPGTNRINVHTIAKANVGFAKYICEHGEAAKKRGVAIAYDNRHMSYEFAVVSAKVLASYGIASYVFESLRPTPELSFAVRHLNCFGGIVVTASHNPKEYNGYKLYDEKGCQLIPVLVDKVIHYVNEVEDELTIPLEVSEDKMSYITRIGSEVDEAYYREVLKIQLQPEIDKKDVKIVFTPQHGTASIPVQEVFKRTNYNCIPVIEQCSPDPNFSNTKTPNPEESASYDLAIEYAKKNQADIVLSCDPDADRMGVVVNQDGEYILLTGNQSGALLLDYILAQLTLQKKMPPNPVMFNTVVTGDLGEKVANAYNVECEKTLTGFKFIGEKIAKYEVTNEKQYVFGYEESYGSLIQPFVRDKDAIQACLMLAEATTYYKQQGKTLVDVLQDLYVKHGFYEESQVSLTLKGSEGAQKIKDILKDLRESKLDTIGEFKVVRFEDYKEAIVRVDNEETKLEGFVTSDVLKYFLEDGSWIAIRPSGTEPKCKFYYCVKGSSNTNAHKKGNALKKAMEKYSV